MGRLQAALALSTLVLASDLCAQGSLEAAFRSLQPGQTVQLRFHGSLRTEARILSVRTDATALYLDGASTPIDGAAIDTLWVKGRAVGTGAIVGAIVAGGGSLLFWGGLICGGQGSCAAVTVVFDLAAVIGGALIGGVIGAAIPKWHLIYARPVPVRGTLRPLPQGRLGIGIAYAVGW